MKGIKADGTWDLRFNGGEMTDVNYVCIIIIIVLALALPGLGNPIFNALIAIPIAIILVLCIIFFITSFFGREINLFPITIMLFLAIPTYNIIVTPGWFITNSSRTTPLSIEQFEHDLIWTERTDYGTRMVSREVRYQENSIRLSRTGVYNLSINSYRDFSVSGFPVGTSRDERYYYFSFLVHDKDDDVIYDTDGNHVVNNNADETWYNIQGRVVYRFNRAIGITWGRPRGWNAGEFTFEVNKLPVNPTGFGSNDGSIVSIHFSDSGITDDMLATMVANKTIPPNIIGLMLSNNQISDISPLISLTELTYLRLNSNQITDISSLEALIQLRGLDLEDNKISDITSLESLKELNVLYLGDNRISDITSLESLTELNVLVAPDNHISDITPLEHLTELTKLELGGNQISDITPLESLTKLERLGLQENSIRDITPLQSLTALISLELNRNRIDDISALKSLTGLRVLFIRDNQITDATPLESLISLERLGISDNPVSYNDEQVQELSAKLHKVEIIP